MEKRVHTFRQSTLNELSMCLERGRLTMNGLMPPTDSDATVRGTAVHAAIEYLLHCKQGGESLSYETAIEVAARSVDQDIASMPHLKWIKYDGLHEVHKMLNHCDVMIATWLDKIEPQIKPARIEDEFDLVLHEDGERVIRLTGTIDCIDQSYRIWDWKTGDAKYAAWEKQRWAIQPTVYAWALAQKVCETESIADRFNFTFACLRTNGTYDLVPVTRNRGDFTWLSERCYWLARLIEAELPLWPTNDQGWWCHEKWCGNWDDCKGGHVLEGWDKAIKM